MKKNIKIFIKALTGVIGVSVFVLLFIFWVNNPILTEMQIFLKFWWAYIVGVIVLIISQLITYE